MTDIVIKLSRPIEAHGETLIELTFREPLGRDMRNAAASHLPGDSWQYELIAQCCGIPSAIIDLMPARDVSKLNRALTDFLDETPQAPSSTPTSTSGSSSEMPPPTSN